ncbi:MAG: hypothetical protein PHD61_08750 [Bacteroidales bacterium]|nr:hypothetical protein [Lentimicrobiaceae bacterium]MDD5695378.1 hypothetical protein [Bacteroidales bacterium]
MDSRTTTASVTDVGPLRYGIMCNEWTFQTWQWKAIRLLEEKGCLPVLLIFNDNPAPADTGYRKLIHYPYKNLLYRMFVRFCHHPPAKKLIDFKNDYGKIESIRCRTQRRGFSEYFQESDIDFIKKKNLDFILRFGFNIIRGEILNITRYGIWSFHHGDEQQYRGGPPGFWEIYHKNPVTGAILQRLTNTLDAGIILRKGYFKTVLHSWSGSIDQLFMETAHWPAQVATDIMNNVNLSWEDSLFQTRAPIYTFPGNRRMIRFMFSLIASRIRFHFDNLTRAEKWNIGMIKAPVTQLLSDATPLRPDWLLSPGLHRYAADPFAMTVRGHLDIFYEFYDYRVARGKISSVRVDLQNGHITPPVIILEKDYHLAYPYLFQVDGNWYCTPESALNRTVDLYRWDDTARKLDFVTTLLSDVDAVDSTIFQYQHRWWLLCTKKSMSDTHLYAWYSREFRGPYEPHSNNPVKTDVRSARPAGPPFVLDGQLLRPAQDCSQAYGTRIVLQQVVRLTPDEFEERQAGTIGPFKDTSFPAGAHTLVNAGEYTIVDAKKYVFDGWNFIHELGRKVKRRVHKRSIKS